MLENWRIEKVTRTHGSKRLSVEALPKGKWSWRVVDISSNMSRGNEEDSFEGAIKAASKAAGLVTWGA